MVLVYAWAGVWKQEESKDNASLTMAESAYYAKLSSEVDLSGTRFSRDAAVQVLPLFMCVCVCVYVYGCI